MNVKVNRQLVTLPSTHLPPSERNMMKIGDLAEATGVSTRLLRYYEEQGLLHPERSANGYRSYPSGAVEIVKQIRALLHAGLPTEVIRCALPCLDGHHIDVSEEPDGPLATRLREELTNIDERIDSLTRHRNMISRYLTPPFEAKRSSPQYLREE
jgi:DNA-binding transcriptional MerR regulator